MENAILAIDNDGIDYHLIEFIGSGVEGDVWKVMNLSNQQIYALKLFTRTNFDQRTFKKSYQFLFSLHHPLIVRFDKYWYGPLLKFYPDSSSCGHLLMQYIEGPSLKNLIKQSSSAQKKTGSASPCVSKNVLLDLVTAVSYLNEEMKIYHGDIETDNIIISNGKPIIFDFGFCGKIKKKPYYDRQSLGLIALNLIVFNYQKMDQFESLIDWKNIRNKVLTRKQINYALNQSSIHLDPTQLPLIESFFDGSSYHRIIKLIHKITF